MEKSFKQSVAEVQVTEFINTFRQPSQMILKA